MFDVNAAVDEWVHRALDEPCLGSRRAAELADHLHCEIERSRAEGHSDEEAFRLATARLGEPGSLAHEMAKNRTVFARALAPLAREDRRWQGRARTLLLVHAFAWAAALVACAAWLSASGADASTRWSVMGTSVPLWWASDLVVKRALGARTAGGTR